VGNDGPLASGGQGGPTASAGRVTGAIIRAAQATDAEQLGSVHVQCWRETYAHLLPAEFLAHVSNGEQAERWRAILAAGDTHPFVAEITGDTPGGPGTIVGFASAGAARDDAAPRSRELYSLYLLAAQHGSGLGRQLLDAAIGDEPAYLWVATDNPRARSFYTRNRFVADGVTKVELIGTHPVDHTRLVR
jgi:GNAT superfamily N-acetyltransferase